MKGKILDPQCYSWWPEIKRFINVWLTDAVVAEAVVIIIQGIQTIIIIEECIPCRIPTEKKNLLCPTMTNS